MSTIALYILPTGSHFATETVNIRKHPTDASKAKPFRFVPLAQNGTDRVKVTRHIISAETFAAWSVETDAAKRAALLTSEPLETASNISPTVAQLALMRALVDRATLAAMLASGTLAVPSTRAERAADTASGKRAMSEAERTAAALDALFAEPEPPTFAEQDGAALVAAIASVDAATPEPTPLVLADPTPEDVEIETIKPAKNKKN